MFHYSRYLGSTFRAIQSPVFEPISSNGVSQRGLPSHRTASGLGAPAAGAFPHSLGGWTLSLSRWQVPSSEPVSLSLVVFCVHVWVLVPLLLRTPII